MYISTKLAAWKELARARGSYIHYIVIDPVTDNRRSDRILKRIKKAKDRLKELGERVR
ncbi:hypothetical protein [uncultured Mediterranean phage]|nr:hypothetical protein [uncultured Mediterranean phage]